MASSSLVQYVAPKSFDAKLVTAMSDTQVADMANMMLTAASKAGLKDKIIAIKTLVEFQGFDVRESQKALAYAFSESYKDADSNKNEENFTNDVLFQLVFFIVRGVASQKTLNRTVEDAAKKYNETATRLAIVKSSPGLPPQVLTAPRLAMCLPIVTTRVCVALGGKNYEGPMRSKIFPAYMKNPAFPAIIPVDNDKITEILAFLYTMYSFDQSYTFAKEKPKQKGFKEIFEKQLTFTHMAISGSTVDNADRIDLLKTLKVPDFIAESARYVKKAIEVFSLPAVTLLSNKDLKSINAGYATAITPDLKDAFLNLAGISKEAKAAAGGEDESI